jgi:HrpA-like RNA helicase
MLDKIQRHPQYNIIRHKTKNIINTKRIQLIIYKDAQKIISMFLRKVEWSRRQWEDILKILCDKNIQNFCIEQKALSKVRRDKLFQIKKR